MPVSSFDHVALPMQRSEEMLRFYGQLGFAVPEVDDWRKGRQLFFSAHLGSQKINFHAPALWQNAQFELRGAAAKPGCGDLCFVWDGGADALHACLSAAGAEVIAGPVELEGGRGTGTSLYVRDPDMNLLEFIVYGE